MRNVLLNDYTVLEEKSKAKTVRQKLRMVNSNADISQSHKILLEKGNDTGSQGLERCEAVTKTVLKIKPHSFLQSHTAESSDAQFDWDGILKELKQCRTCDEIVAIVRKHKLTPLQHRRKYRQTLNDRIDHIAQHFMPADLPANFIPIVTLGLGNCFSHALLHALFGTQNKYVKIRVRLVFKAVLNEDLHLSNQYLSLGCTERLPARPNLRSPSTTIVSRYCTYTGDDSVRGWRLTEDEMKTVYRCDVLKISKPGAYTGIWQFHQAAKFMKIPIGIVYPHRNVNENIQFDMNRMILPHNPAFHNKAPIYIMWSPLSVKS